MGRIRIYLNLEPEHVTDTLVGTYGSFVERGLLETQMKICRILGAIYYRTEKICIVTQLHYWEMIREVLVDLHDGNPDAFRPEIPKATVPFFVGNPLDKLPGIGLAEDPIFPRPGDESGQPESLNKVSAYVLADVLLRAHEEGTWLDDDSFPVDEVFDETCRSYKRDPEIPGINLGGDRESFYRLITGQKV